MRICMPLEKPAILNAELLLIICSSINDAGGALKLYTDQVLPIWQEKKLS